MARAGSWMLSPHSQPYFHFLFGPQRKPRLHSLRLILSNSISAVPCKNIQEFTFHPHQPYARFDIEYSPVAYMKLLQVQIYVFVVWFVVLFF